MAIAVPSSVSHRGRIAVQISTKAGWRIGLPLAAILALASCGQREDASPTASVVFKALRADGKRFNGRPVIVRGCLKGNPHGILISSCPYDVSEASALSTDDLRDWERQAVYIEALKAGIVPVRQLPVVACGIYRQSADARDSWIEVESVAWEGRSFGDPLCRARGSR
jgi:hypothetical protein